MLKVQKSTVSQEKPDFEKKRNQFWIFLIFSVARINRWRKNVCSYFSLLFWVLKTDLHPLLLYSNVLCGKAKFQWCHLNIKAKPQKCTALIRIPEQRCDSQFTFRPSLYMNIALLEVWACPGTGARVSTAGMSPAVTSPLNPCLFSGPTLRDSGW